MPNAEPSRDSLLREKARLRKIGVAVLLLGLVSAVLLYWIRYLGRPFPDNHEIG